MQKDNRGHGLNGYTQGSTAIVLLTMSIRMTPFKALDGYEALNFADLVLGENRAPKAKDWVQDSQDILKVVKENL